MKLVVAAVLSIAVSGWAQDAPPAAQQPSEGDAATQVQSEYGGPALLSRGGGPSVLTGDESVRLVPFVSVTGRYDSSLGNATVNSQGQTVYQDIYGGEGSFGVTGSRVWEHSVLDLDYHGSYRDYANYPSYNGLNNSLQLSFQHQLTPRLSITLSEDGSRTHNVSSLPMSTLYGGGFSSYNPVYNALTANTFENTPYDALVSTVRLVYQWTSRWSISVGGTEMIMRQRVQSLLGVDGTMLDADIAYRLSRYQTISFNYAFSHFGYKGQFGQSDIHGGGMSYSIRVGRYWEVGLGAGVSRVASLRAVPVAIPLDPSLGLGDIIVLEKLDNVVYSPYGGVHLTRNFRRSSWTAAYNRSVQPGNGLYATSGYESANTYYSYNGSRRVSLQVGAAYNRFSAVIQPLGSYHSYQASGGFNCRIVKAVSAVGQVYARRYTIAGATPTRNEYSTSLGFAWNPGQYPVSLW